jgi:HEAT repeat protein
MTTTIHDSISPESGIEHDAEIFPTNCTKQSWQNSSLLFNFCQGWRSALMITLLSFSSAFAFAPHSWSQETTNEIDQGQLNSPELQRRLDEIEFLSRKAGAGQNNPIQPTVITDLIQALQDPNPEIRFRAVDALTGIGTGAENAIQSLVDILQDQQQPADLRYHAIVAIRSINAGLAVKPLIQALDDPDPGVRSQAALALGSTREKAHNTVAKLISLLETDPYEQVRGSAAEALGKIAPANPEVLSTLNKALEDRSWRVRRRAADALAKVGTGAKDAVPNLLKALDNQNYTLRSSAAKTLGLLGPEAITAVSDLQKALQENDNPFAQGLAAEALGNIGVSDPATLETLIHALSHSSAYVRDQAFKAFHKIAIPMADQLLAQEEIQPDELQQTIGYFEDALEKMDLPNSGFSEAQKESLQPALKRLKFKQTEEDIINIILKNPWVWGVMVYLCLNLGLFYLRPLWLLNIDEFLKPLNFKVPLLGMAISPRFLLFLKFHSRVLDAWVAAHIPSVQEEFHKKKTVQARQVYISSPVIIDGHTVPQISSQDLRATFNKHLLIWGEGGVGKTSLACQIAQWAMAEKEDERLCKHRMLPILIEEDLDCQGEACKRSLLDAILGQLEDLANEQEPISEELLERLLRQRRILVIFDHLSEMSEQTQEIIDPGKPDFPINALIVTSRQEEKLGRVNKTTIKPLRIMGNRLSSFMEAYLMQRGKRDLFTDSEFFDACSRLSRMVGQREVTAMLATLYAEQLIAAKVGVMQEISILVPDNIPDLMISYLNELNRDLEDQFDDRTVHQDAKALAWACVQEMYRPATIKWETAIAALAARGEKAEEHLQYLEERLRLIYTIGATKDRLHFSLDPLAEYLAGLYLIDLYNGDETQWLEFLEKAETLLNHSAASSGFLRAVLDCCLARSKETKISPLILTKLTQIQSETSQLIAAQTSIKEDLILEKSLN